MQRSTERKKIKVEKTLYTSYPKTNPTWKDLIDSGIDFQDEDKIFMGWIEGYYSENNSWDGHFKIEITRMVEETDEEFEKRILRNEQDQRMLKERRRETYLKLKEEFENEE